MKTTLKRYENPTPAPHTDRIVYVPKSNLCMYYVDIDDKIHRIFGDTTESFRSYSGVVEISPEELVHFFGWILSTKAAEDGKGEGRKRLVKEYEKYCSARRKL